MSNYEERFSPPARPGPKPGSGAISRWILERLAEADADLDGLMLGCAYKRASVEAVLGRLVSRGVVLPTEARTRPRGRPCTVYRLNPEVPIADPRYARITPARQSNSNPVRHLSDAFARIVGGR